MVDLKRNNKFNDSFFWGASISAHQVEGNNHNQWTVWELENAKVRSVQSEYKIGDYVNWDKIESQAKDPNNYVSGSLGNHYKFFKKDFDLLGKMNMNALRFSIEWSRIEPQDDAWDIDEIKHYKEYLDELKLRGIEPIVTLFHFSLPTWFAEKGGFEKRANIKYFSRFAKKILSELGSSIKYVITINEPEVYCFESYYSQNWPPAKRSLYKYLQVINNLACAHRKVSKIIHRISSDYKISIAKNSVYFYAGDNAWLSRLSAKLMCYVQDGYFISKVIKHCDFLGVNYYFSDRVYGYRVHNQDQKLSDLNWSMQPGDIQHVLERLYFKYKKPIIITENGVADSGDIHRKWWITQTIIAMQNAMKNGVELDGYLHWSLIDNFEWAFGKWPRFGLAQIDYKTGERKLRPSAIWFGGVIKRIRKK
ncbi:MAG: family 1 glycosylhydrolase [Candidatus Saccharibacteria bacterium]